MQLTNHPDWTHVRIRRSTKERLEAIARRMASYFHKTGRGPSAEGESFSVDAMLTVLLDREEDHAERNRRQSAKRRAAREPKAAMGTIRPCTEETTARTVVLSLTGDKQDGITEASGNLRPADLANRE